MHSLFSTFSWYNLLDTLIKILVATLLSGFIGYEREHSHRPAGFRTHILVCVGSALIMTLSKYMFNEYMDSSVMDLVRMPAQVISGIGFLGAGTILREGFSVKGLTTAASLWAVSCIGLTIGAGYYGEALVATLVIYLTLNVLRKIITRKRTGVTIFIEVSSLDEQIKSISRIIRKCEGHLKALEIVDAATNSKFKRHKGTTVIKAWVFPRDDFMLDAMIDSIRLINGVVDLYVE
ncbi:MAG: MgtC/SapB family protein [Clostridiales bacterium]|nr:MgtC/SapB family protein [Clostridiales bacterium]